MQVNDLKVKKDRIREKYKAIRKAVTGDEKARLDSAVCKTFLSSATYIYYDTILMYSPVRDEINVNEIALQALRDGKRVAYPRCVSGTNKMDFYYVSSLDELEKGTFGILEPPCNEARKVDKANATGAVCLIPAIVFDKCGYRLGYGKGYYDRYLHSYSGAVLGIAYKRLVTNALPKGRFDIQVNAVITEEGVISVERD